MNELVSIVVPVYNMENSIKNCVKSLQLQDYPEIEIILVDDGSKDRSYDRCIEISKQDKRVRVIHTENRGSGPARNTGIDNSNGKYIYFPDADDYLEAQAISILVKAMDYDNYDLVVFGFKKVNQDGEIISIKSYKDEDYYGSKIRNSYTPFMTMDSELGIQGAPWNKFFSKLVIDENNIRFPKLRRHQDEAFIAQYVSCAKRVHFIESVLYTYFVNDLKNEWDKYPITYIDAVRGLYSERKKNILCWNSNDVDVHDLVYKEYICNYIKALELSFSPKFNFKRKSRKKWMKKQINSMEKIKCPKHIDKYHRFVYMLIQKNSRMIYPMLHLKVLIEKVGLLAHIKRLF